MEEKLAQLEGTQAGNSQGKDPYAWQNQECARNSEENGEMRWELLLMYLRILWFSEHKAGGKAKLKEILKEQSQISMFTEPRYHSLKTTFLH